MNRTSRLIYGIFFILLFIAEVLIGLFVDDRFVRPYLGDVLITILLCCLCRTILPNGIPGLPIYVLMFAALVETAQYFEIVKVLGLEHNRLLSTLIGTSFSHIDLICYAIGCLMFWAVEKACTSILKHRFG